MSRQSWLQKIYWTRFAKPVEERALFAHLISQPVASILEIGIGAGERMRRVANLAQAADGIESIRYVGTDEFESSKDGKRHLTLKQAHQVAGQLGFRATLMPGDAASALPRVAHKIGMSDLIIVDGGLDPANPTVGAVANWLSRVAHEKSALFACSEQGAELVRVNLTFVESEASRAA